MRMLRACIPYLALILAVINTSAAQTPVFHFVQCPGAKQTALRGLNNHNVAVGSCTDSNDLFHGFILDKDGTTKIDHPSGTHGTFLDDINSDGTIVGYYLDDLDLFHAFVYANGTFSEIGPPNAEQTLAYGIDDLGRITGEFIDANGVDAGWIFDGKNYRVVHDNDLSAGVEDINLNNTFLLVWERFQNIFRSSICTPAGCSKIDIPGAIDVRARKINSVGNITLSWTKDENKFHGAILVGQRVINVNAPGCDVTFPYGINDRNVITGGCAQGPTRVGFYAFLNGK